MSVLRTPQPHWLSKPSLYPTRATWLRRADAIAQVVGVGAIVLGHGIKSTSEMPWEFGAVTICAMLTITLGIWFRFRWSLKQPSFVRRYRATVLAAGIWAAGMVIVTVIGPVLPDTNGSGLGGPRWWGYVHLSELIVAIYSISGTIRGLRRLSSGGINPAFLLVMSFAFLISIGTVLLMLPICATSSTNGWLQGAPFEIALFTAASASCVTGLIVVDTPSYWTTTGHLVILGLFQAGGLGMMTFGAFFAAVAGKNVKLSEFATLKDLLAPSGLGDFRSMVYAIIGFTVSVEVIGALLLMPQFAELSLREQLFSSLFHSVSAFCNAGFSLNSDSFLNQGDTFCIGGVLAGLIIIGGLGFGVLQNVASFSWQRLRALLRQGYYRAPQRQVRLRLETKFVLSATISLLIAGTFLIYLLERTDPTSGGKIGWADAWFQSVTLRTAGFNTVEIGDLQPATKLFGVLLMIIGASPGSTGGGLKTVVFAVGAVGLLAVVRGRDRVEAFGRTISSTSVNRALAMVFVFLMTVMTTTLLLVIFERRPEHFLDLLFEAASAAGTVGVSSSVTLASGEVVSTTTSLTAASRYVIILTMFLGRIGPLTLLLALAGQTESTRYEYPTERVTLG